MLYWMCTEEAGESPLPFFFSGFPSNMRKNSHNLIAIILLGTALIAVSIPSVWAFSGDDVVRLANEERSAVGVDPLQRSDTLNEVAATKFADMRDSQYFDHTSPSGKTPWSFFENAGYVYRYAGENLAINFSDASKQEQAWMESQKHCENVIDPRFRETGVATGLIDFKGKQTTLTVQVFGTTTENVTDALPIIGTPFRDKVLSLCPKLSPTAKVEMALASANASTLVGKWLEKISVLTFGTIVMFSILEIIAVFVLFALLPKQWRRAMLTSSR